MTENVGAALERAGRLYADREAIVDGELRWSYGELRRHVAAFDAALDGLGLAPGDVVAVLALNSAAHLVAWLGIPRSGRVLTDLNVRLAPAELEFVLADSGARALLVDDAFLALGKELVQRCGVGSLVHIGTGPAPGGCVTFAEMTDRRGRPPAAVDPEQPAGIFYTGGTTGRPKGVMLTHRNLVANAKHALITLGYGPDDTYLHAAPMFHAADANANLALTWVGGRHVVIPAFDPARWSAAVEAERVTQSVLVPAMVNMIVHHSETAQHDLACLRQVVYAGSPMPQEMLRRAMQIVPCDWAQAYGMTEAAPLVTYLTPEEHRRGAVEGEPHATRLRSVGRPVVGVDAEVRRPDGSAADVGEPGEVWVRGPNIMKGYWNRLEETTSALDDDGWYRTGDAGHCDADGYLYIVDRISDMIISGGENVYPVEVEQVLYRHRAVREVAVVGVPHAKWGETPIAVVALKDGAQVTGEELIGYARARLAHFKCPTRIECVAELPRNATGKVLKTTLRKEYGGHDTAVLR
jgi:long-chain acyl-CoA synthetase